MSSVPLTGSSESIIDHKVDTMNLVSQWLYRSLLRFPTQNWCAKHFP